ncbi:hypothetical protein LO772_04080 [Yinghuangia sp. ASG 101]|uniref:hypothetical protein n=1 Tax=Yinghuangia sp. ASG 101 TaxID=2896848 RepID=UPI001E4F42F9|nr:hypothetical protein [Yinghuangia sp. ASG 101]UGQ12809.1 hypothetical protein LO772_04080 [Yinghuangia sp. ASG 101]
MPIQTARPSVFPRDLRGEFETHVTFRCAAAEVDALAAWGRERGAGLTHIVLDRGHTTSQPMLTLRATTTLAEARDAAGALADAAREAGFRAVRVKVEAAPWHPGVPATDADAAALGPAYYFEHHVKLLLEQHRDTRELAAIAIRHGAHLSHNARRHRADGRRERFVTQRSRGVGNARAADQLDALIAVLHATHHRILSHEREFVVFDDGATLDDGWIDERIDHP